MPSLFARCWQRLPRGIVEMMDEGKSLKIHLKSKFASDFLLISRWDEESPGIVACADEVRSTEVFLTF